MKIYDSITTRAGNIRKCRLCHRPARVRSTAGGSAYCLDHYIVEVGKSCSLGGRVARREVEEMPVIGIWLTAMLRMGYARQHVLKSYPRVFDNAH